MPGEKRGAFQLAVQPLLSMLKLFGVDMLEQNEWERDSLLSGRNDRATVSDERWIAVSTALTHSDNELHPHALGEHACSAFAWIDLIGMADWDGPERGRLHASVRFLSQRWNWSKDRVQRFLVQLERDGRIFRATQQGKDPGWITIAKYEQYQYEPGELLQGTV